MSRSSTSGCARLWPFARASLVLALLAAGGADGGRVRQALFGSFFGTKKEHTHQNDALADAEQAELVDFLRANGFGKYASKDYIERLDDELAYDSIEDMTHLVADDDYTEINMPREDALQIQKLARREMLKRFLASVPLPEGAATGLFGKHLDALITAGYDEPDDVADLEEDEAERMGIALEHVKILVGYAEEYEARLLLHIILTTYVGADKRTPYEDEAVWRPMIDALVKAGVRSLSDVALLNADVPGVAKEDLAALQSDPRVLQHVHKQEL